MIIYNLTDLAPQGRKVNPQNIKINGKLIEPGRSLRIIGVDLSKLSGMIYGSKISIDERPEWYIKIKRQMRRKSVADVVEDSAPEEDEGLVVEETSAEPNVVEFYNTFSKGKKGSKKKKKDK